jgi:hypothetical protein
MNFLRRLFRVAAPVRPAAGELWENRYYPDSVMFIVASGTNHIFYHRADLPVVPRLQEMTMAEFITIYQPSNKPIKKASEAF